MRSNIVLGTIVAAACSLIPAAHAVDGTISNSYLAAVGLASPPAPSYKKLWGQSYVKGVHSIKWTPAQGWKGLVPGKTTLSEVFTKLGKPAAVHKEVGGWTTYRFVTGESVSIQKSSPVIGALTVYPTHKYQQYYPLTVHDARMMYRPIRPGFKVEYDVTTHFLSRPGLTIDIESNQDNSAVNSLRFTPANTSKLR
ncbi:MAG TPA: hypothetical protein V6C81_03290 [Planktothrix sp.]|jgi:hypothetical protein